MATELLHKLEHKIEHAVESIELLKLQLEELEENNSSLTEENLALKTKQASWEKNLTAMLDKLNNVSAFETSTSNKVCVEFEESVS